ncbi:hypothetical protein GE09DRAFT_147451 [Coniochaeta sp. 2T2.1]|nr:hypothetical protein GE09DRAFT_147451 [Coniochaeta sp. 2T2.1]
MTKPRSSARLRRLTVRSSLGPRYVCVGRPALGLKHSDSAYAAARFFLLRHSVVARQGVREKKLTHMFPLLCSRLPSDKYQFFPIPSSINSEKPTHPGTGRRYSSEEHRVPTRNNSARCSKTTSHPPHRSKPITWWPWGRQQGKHSSLTWKRPWSLLVPRTDIDAWAEHAGGSHDPHDVTGTSSLLFEGLIFNALIATDAHASLLPPSPA